MATEWQIKFDQRMTKQLDKDTLLVFREKHGNRYFLVPTIKELYAAALKVITERFEEEWFYEPDPIEITPSDDLTKADLERIAKYSYGEEFVKAYKSYTEQKAEYDRDLAEYRRLEQAVKDEDGRMAWAILQERKDWEYENYSLESLEDVSKEKVTL